VKLGAAEGSWYIDNTSMITNSPFVFTENSFKSDPLTIKTYGTEDEYMSLNYEFKVKSKYLKHLLTSVQQNFSQKY
jgi:hypothetical protein